MERSSSSSSAAAVCEINDDLNLRLGLPGRDESERPSSSCNKRSSSEMESSDVPESKAQVVGWPPVRSYRKKALKQSESGMFVKVSMDGAPYLRKIDLKFYKNYLDLLKALETMFNCTIGVYSEREGYNYNYNYNYNGCEFVPTYEDKEGDWMLVGDVPWEMFITSCNRFRIIKPSQPKTI